MKTQYFSRRLTPRRWYQVIDWEFIAWWAVVLGFVGWFWWAVLSVTLKMFGWR